MGEAKKFRDYLSRHAKRCITVSARNWQANLFDGLAMDGASHPIRDKASAQSGVAASLT